MKSTLSTLLGIRQRLLGPAEALAALKPPWSSAPLSLGSCSVAHLEHGTAGVGGRARSAFVPRPESNSTPLAAVQRSLDVEVHEHDSAPAFPVLCRPVCPYFCPTDTCLPALFSVTAPEWTRDLRRNVMSPHVQRDGVSAPASTSAHRRHGLLCRTPSNTHFCVTTAIL